MKGLIINNGNPSAVTVDHDGVTVTFSTFVEACKYADTIREKRFPEPQKIKRGQDITGYRFGRLTVLSELKGEKKWGKPCYLCQCACGNQKTVVRSSLLSGMTKSCGCLAKEQAKEAAKKMIKHNQANGYACVTKHGKARRGQHSRSYKAWMGMKRRCHNPNDKTYLEYGAKGITVIDRWHVYENFLADMGECPDGLSIERIDYTKGYSPENCKWATTHEQCRNRSNNRKITAFGRTQVLTDWANEFGIPVSALTYRIDAGWDVETAISKRSRKHA